MASTLPILVVLATFCVTRMRCTYVGFIDPMASLRHDVHKLYKRQTNDPFTQAEQDSILEAHNSIRSTVSPTAGDMQYMTWDTALADSATAWSQQCKWFHGQVDPNLNVGQNLYISTNKVSGATATTDWASEVNYFDYCASGTRCNVTNPGCGHYTQIVWATTNKVGCGRAFCSTVHLQNGNVLVGFDNSYIITCNYSPGGNIHYESSPGSQVYVLGDPYQLGERCSKCDPGTICHRGMCVTQAQCDAFSLQCGCERQCQSCGTLTPQCTCSCPTGFSGNDCSDGATNGNQACCQGLTCPSNQIIDTTTCQCTVPSWDVCSTSGSGTEATSQTTTTTAGDTVTTSGGETTTTTQTTQTTTVESTVSETTQTTTGTETTPNSGSSTLNPLPALTPAPECSEDLYSNCEELKDSGYCTLFESVRTGCPFSCNECKFTCGGMVCQYGGKLNYSTCECNCPDDAISGNICQNVERCEQPTFCSSFIPQYCAPQYVITTSQRLVLAVCPQLCIAEVEQCFNGGTLECGTCVCDYGTHGTSCQEVQCGTLGNSGQDMPDCNLYSQTQCFQAVPGLPAEKVYQRCPSLCFPSNCGAP